MRTIKPTQCCLWSIPLIAFLLVLLLHASLKEGKGDLFWGELVKIYLRVVRGKVTRVGDKRSRYFYYLWGQSWSIYWYSLPKWCNLVVLTAWSLWTLFGFTNTICRTEAPRRTRSYSLFQFLHKGRNTADQGCDTKGSMACVDRQWSRVQGCNPMALQMNPMVLLWLCCCLLRDTHQVTYFLFLPLIYPLRLYIFQGPTDLLFLLGVW